ncbi:aromatase/cyclase [Streptomyces sp. NPDC041068]|uniref:aromatase/cyclase n=1 Tax=Streptomyces sp. NPDC041068 TaxID=3155130 RepID=UPI0033C637EA
MTANGPREVEHEITVEAPAQEAYRLIADVGNWPRLFPPTIFVDQVATGADRERIRIWATANGKAKTWTSLRTLDPRALRIGFRQEVSAPPVASMGGAWVIEPLSGTTSRIRLLHHYTAVDDAPDGLAWIDRAVDTNSRSELAALKTNVELAHRAQAVTFSFEDTVTVHGAGKDVYDFVNEAQLWPERLPHVASVRLTEDEPGLQLLRMDTRAKDGSTHTTESHRVCLPHHRIAYKQVTLPALMSLHTGYWTFEETRDGTAASSQHTVVLNTENIEKVLGPGATAQDARGYVQEALSTNSRATLGHAKAYAEGRRRP